MLNAMQFLWGVEMTLYYQVSNDVFVECNGQDNGDSSWNIVADGKKLLSEDLDDIGMVCDYIFRGGIHDALREAEIRKDKREKLVKSLRDSIKTLKERDVWHELSNIENIANGESDNISDMYLSAK